MYFNNCFSVFHYSISPKCTRKHFYGHPWRGGPRHLTPASYTTGNFVRFPKQIFGYRYNFGLSGQTESK